MCTITRFGSERCSASHWVETISSGWAGPAELLGVSVADKLARPISKHATRERMELHFMVYLRQTDEISLSMNRGRSFRSGRNHKFIPRRVNPLVDRAVVHGSPVSQILRDEVGK